MTVDHQLRRSAGICGQGFFDIDNRAEGGIAALATSAGSSAITYAILTIARAGDNVVSVPQLYGGTYTLFAHQLPARAIVRMA